MDHAETIESLVAWWKADGDYAPDAPPAAEAVQAFADWHRQRFGSDPPPAFVHFLTLADGGQYDAYYLFALADIMDATEDGLPFTLIGDSGNVDRFILRPNGSCATVSLFTTRRYSRIFPILAGFLLDFFTALSRWHDRVCRSCTAIMWVSGRGEGWHILLVSVPHPSIGR